MRKKIHRIKGNGSHCKEGEAKLRSKWSTHEETSDRVDIESHKTSLM